MFKKTFDKIPLQKTREGHWAAPLKMVQKPFWVGDGEGQELANADIGQ